MPLSEETLRGELGGTGALPWAACRVLQAHRARMATTHMRDLFAADPARAERFSLQVGDVLLDYSKNRVTDETMALLMRLAEEADVATWRERMFGGEAINNTEGRAVLHSKMISNVREVQARGARTIMIAEPGDEASLAIADHLKGL